MKYILNEEEYAELKRNNDSYIYELEKECSKLREENKLLKARLEFYELTTKDRLENPVTKQIFDNITSYKGFNF